MNAEWKQLACAYRREEGLYRQVLELVRDQGRIMETAPDPGSILELCGAVDRLMDQITTIEDAIRPVKERWERARDDPDGELSSVLATIEGTIEQITRQQENVQNRLLDYMQRQKERTDGARASVKASRARRLYRAG
jgi:chromosome segregation ATPase